MFAHFHTIVTLSVTMNYPLNIDEILHVCFHQLRFDLSEEAVYFVMAYDYYKLEQIN